MPEYRINSGGIMTFEVMFFFVLIDKNFGLKYSFFGFGGQNNGLRTDKKTGK